MRISAINVSKPVLSKNSNQNFKGLWGRSTSDVYENSTTYCESTYHTYYPFKNESRSEIDAVVDRYSDSSSSCADPGSVHDPIMCSSTTRVSVASKLPFTENEFRSYLNNPNSTIKRYIIEKIIQDNDLEEHIHY